MGVCEYVDPIEDQEHFLAAIHDLLIHSSMASVPRHFRTAPAILHLRCASGKEVEVGPVQSRRMDDLQIDQGIDVIATMFS